jgi:pimeloyl-ACP methyl ester carboxylesterase
MSKIARLTLSSILTSALSFAVMSTIMISVLAGSASAQQHLTGTLGDGATYVIDVPALWNGTLLLYSHGYVAPGSPNPALDVSDPFTSFYMLASGNALAGSSYASTGWAVHEAVPDQIATLDLFQSMVGTPTRTIAWGHSLGGEVTAALVQQYPSRFDAALPMCGVLAGSEGFFNQALDQTFAFNTLLAGGSLEMVHITNPALDYGTAAAILAAAQTTPQGQARIALVSALADKPGWYDPTTPEPAATDFATQEANQYLWVSNEIPSSFFTRAEMEFRAGGNPSFNTGIRYDYKLKRSRDYAEVQALYAAAGLSLDADLAVLKGAPRISADPGALTYLTDNVIYNGQITVPVLTLHTTGDGTVNVEQERAYRRVVDEADNAALLRQRFIHRAGHCEFSPAEMIVAEQTLELRLATGKWSGLGIVQLNKEATALGPEFNVIDVNGAPYPAASAFMSYEPLQFLRLFDAFKQ